MHNQYKGLLNYKIICCNILFLIFYSSCSIHKTTTKSSKTNNSNKAIKGKYATLLGVSENTITNAKLYAFIDDWYATPYQYAGKSKKGIDCSGFASVLTQQIYNKMINGSAADIYKLCKPLSKKELKEGDLVFFKIESTHISHVGVYLQHNKFVHASTKKGVIINDLDEPYYKKYFHKAGRVN